MRISISVLTLSMSLSISMMLALSTPAHPQDCHSWQAHCYPDAGDYYGVLDALFPRVRSENPWPENPYVVLRFLPLGEPEFQIVIQRMNKGNYEVHRYSLPRGSKRVSEQVPELRAAHPNDPPQKLAEYIKVEHKTLTTDPKEVAAIMNALGVLKLSAQLDSNAILDASGYDFWFVASPGCNILHVSVADSHYGHDAKAHPLVRWMNNVRRAVEEAERRTK